MLRGRAIAVTAVLVVVLALSACKADKASDTVGDGQGSGAMKLTSASFEPAGRLPDMCATVNAGGQNVSPQLAWSGAPAGTQSFALEVVDVHPRANRWVHWLVTDLSSKTTSLAQGASQAPSASVEGAGSMPSGSREHANGFGSTGWGGPQPPSGSGEHEYLFTVYALDVGGLDLPAGATRSEFERAIGGHVLDSASLSGTFSR